MSNIRRFRPGDEGTAATPHQQIEAKLGRAAMGAPRKAAKPLNVLFFARLCERGGIPRPVAEYEFHPARKWRLDLAWLEQRVALEVNGGHWTGGRHNTAKGAAGDWVKINEAQIMHWIVLQVPRSASTADDWLNMGTVELVKRAIDAKAGR